MAGVLDFVQDVAWLMRNAALRKDVPTFQMATVVSPGSTPTVMIDGTTTQRQVTRNMAGQLRTGQRVRVEVQGTNLTVIVAAPMDTGWVNIPLTSGFAGRAHMRREGHITEVRFEVAAGSLPVGNTTVASGTPSEFLPLVDNARIPAYFPSGFTGVAYLTPTGDLGISHQTGATRTYMLARGMWRND